MNQGIKMIKHKRTIATEVIKSVGRCWTVEFMCTDCPIKEMCNSKEKRSTSEIINAMVKYLENHKC